VFYSESDLESAIIGQIERFLLEMGKGFSSRRAKSDSPSVAPTRRRPSRE
jgi:hypothetical protein